MIILNLGNMLERSLSARVFSAVSWLVLSSTTSSRWFAYFSNLSTILSRIFAWLQYRTSWTLSPKYQTWRTFYFLTVFWSRSWEKTNLSGLVSFSCLLIDPNGGRWSGFSLQQALSSALMFSSHSWSHSAGRRGSPWKGVRNCMMISGKYQSLECWNLGIFSLRSFQSCSSALGFGFDHFWPNWNVSASTGWTAMKFGAGIHDL